MSPEDERLEQIKQWWKEYRWTLVSGVSLGLAIIVGYNVWNRYDESRTAAVSDLYERMTILAVEGRHAAVNDAVRQIVDEFPKTDYAAKAMLVSARSHHELGDAEKARESLQWVIDNAQEASSVHGARLGMARIMIVEEEYEGALSLLEVGKMDGFDSHYHELRGDAYRGLDQVGKAHEAYTLSLDTLSDDSSYRPILVLKVYDTNVQDGDNS